MGKSSTLDKASYTMAPSRISGAQHLIAPLAQDVEQGLKSVGLENPPGVSWALSPS